MRVVETEDYSELLEKFGKDRAVINILFSLFKDLTYYRQWLNGKKLTSKGLKSEATRCAKRLLTEYPETKDNIWW